MLCQLTDYKVKSRLAQKGGHVKFAHTWQGQVKVSLEGRTCYVSSQMQMVRSMSMQW